MPYAPMRPGGTSPEARFDQWVWDMIHALRPQDAPGMVTHRTTRGVVRIPKAVKGGGGISISAFKFVAKGDDYIECHSWDGTTEGTEPVNIALPFKLRDSRTTETIDGTVITYSAWDSDAQSRLATDDSDPPKTETQVITPRYLPGDTILAAPAFSGVEDDSDPPKTLTLVDLNVDARFYARSTGQ